MRRIVKTLALLAAAVVYVPLVIDWCAPGHGFHQAAVALGGYGPDALHPLTDFLLWDRLVRLVGWDLQGLGTLSMLGALISLGLIAYIADRMTRGSAPLSTGLVCAAFVAVPGFLRAATRPDPLFALLVPPLLGLALLTHLPAKSECGTSARSVRRHPWRSLGSALLLAYGAFECACLDAELAVGSLVCLIWFAVLGCLPHILLAKRLRRHEASRRFRIRFFGIWIAAIACSAFVAAKSFGRGRASGRLAARIIANAGRDRALAADPAFADVYRWTSPPDRRNPDPLSRTDAVVRPPLSAERCFPTVDLWRAGAADFAAMPRNEPHRDRYRELLRACGDRLGKQLLDANDPEGAWTVFWEVLDGVDGEDDAAVLNLCGLIERGHAADPEFRERLSRKLLRSFHGMKLSERMTEDETETARAMQRAIRLGVSRGFVRSDLIGQKLLDLDLLLGDWESAERDARGVLSLDRQNLLANTVRGVVLARQGNSAEARYHFRLVADRAKFFRGQGEDANLEKVIRVLRNLKGLEPGLLSEIAEIGAHE